MATNVTYSSLFNDVTVFLERGASATTDPTVYNQIPRLINSAERKLADSLKILGMKEVLSGAPIGLQINEPVLTKPDRWRATSSMNYGTGTNQNSRTPLFPRSYEYCTAYWPDRSQTSPPLFYADYDYQHWLICPTPDQNYPLEVVAYMLPALLDNTNQSNFWTEYLPNLLLYGTLIEATPFLKDDPRLAVWGQYYTDEMNRQNTQDIQRMMDQAAERSRT